jgi:hypothetical protein
MSAQEVIEGKGEGYGVDGLMEREFTKGLFPEDVWCLPMSRAILNGWSPKFATKGTLCVKPSNILFLTLHAALANVM